MPTAPLQHPRDHNRGRADALLEVGVDSIHLSGFNSDKLCISSPTPPPERHLLIQGTLPEVAPSVAAENDAVEWLPKLKPDLQVAIVTITGIWEDMRTNVI